MELSTAVLESGLPQRLGGKEFTCNSGDIGNAGLIPSSGKSPGGGNGTPLQYSCLGNSIDRGPWWAAVHGATKSQMQLSKAFLFFLWLLYRSEVSRGGGLGFPDAIVSRQVVSDSFATPQTVARQALLSMGFPRQESWSGLPFPSPGDLPDPGIKPASPALRVDSLAPSHLVLVTQQ